MVGLFRQKSGSELSEEFFDSLVFPSFKKSTVWNISMLQVLYFRFCSPSENFWLRLSVADDAYWRSAALNKKLSDEAWGWVAVRLVRSEMAYYEKFLRLIMLVTVRQLADDVLAEIFLNEKTRFLLAYTESGRRAVDFAWKSTADNPLERERFAYALLGVMSITSKEKLTQFTVEDLVKVLSVKFENFAAKNKEKTDVILAQSRVEGLLFNPERSFLDVDMLPDAVVLAGASCSLLKVKQRTLLLDIAIDRNLESLQDYPRHWAERLVGLDVG